MAYCEFLEEGQDGLLVGVGAAASRGGGEGLGGVGGEGERGTRAPSPLYVGAQGAGVAGARGGGGRRTERSVKRTATVSQRSRVG